MSPFLKRVSEFAIWAHGVQVRKYSGEPYWHHPKAVAELASRFTDDDTIIAAAWLHDVVEDTKVSIQTIEELFGADVAGIVEDLTDRYTHELYPQMNREERKQAEAARLANIGWRAKLVKLCDIMHNAEDIEANDKDFAVVWKKEKYRAVRRLLGGGHA